MRFSLHSTEKTVRRFKTVRPISRLTEDFTLIGSVITDFSADKIGIEGWTGHALRFLVSLEMTVNIAFSKN